MGVTCASASVDFTQRTSHRRISLVKIQQHLKMHLWRLVCLVIWECKNVYVCFLGRREKLNLWAKGKKRREMEGRDGWGQFGGPGCFNYPLLCRWVRTRYLSLALSPSHDLSSTFIPKPSAPLAKQRKKGGHNLLLLKKQGWI